MSEAELIAKFRKIHDLKECVIFMDDLKYFDPRKYTLHKIFMKNFDKTRVCRDNIVSKGRAKYKCNNCPLKFVYHFELVDHVKEYHPELKQLETEDSPDDSEDVEVFGERRTRNAAKKEGSTSKELIKLCPTKESADAEAKKECQEIIRAKQNKDESKNYACAVCLKIVPYRMYASHLFDHGYLCLICMQAFQNGKELDEHMKIHKLDIEQSKEKGSVSNPTSSPNKNVDSKDSSTSKPDANKELISYNFQPDKNLKYCCQYCDKKFADCYQLRRHEIVHVKNGNSDTDKSTKPETVPSPIQASLTAEKKKLPKLSCIYCPEKFNTEPQVKQHYMKFHSSSLAATAGIKPLDKLNNKNKILVYSCKLCNSKFNRESDAKTHYESVHKKKPTPSISTPKTKNDTNIKKYACGVCYELFLSESDVLVHYQAVHVHAINANATNQDGKSTNTNKKSFSCPLCIAQFDSEVNLEVHCKAVHLVAVTTANLDKLNDDEVVFVPDTSRQGAQPQEDASSSFICSVCDDVFSSKVLLDKHAQFHKQLTDNLTSTQNNTQQKKSVSLLVNKNKIRLIPHPLPQKSTSASLDSNSVLMPQVLNKPSVLIPTSTITTHTSTTNNTILSGTPQLLNNTGAQTQPVHIPVYVANNQINSPQYLVTDLNNVSYIINTINSTGVPNLTVVPQSVLNTTGGTITPAIQPIVTASASTANPPQQGSNVNTTNNFHNYSLISSPIANTIKTNASTSENTTKKKLMTVSKLTIVSQASSISKPPASKYSLVSKTSNNAMMKKTAKPYGHNKIYQKVTIGPQGNNILKTSGGNILKPNDPGWNLLKTGSFIKKADLNIPTSVRQNLLNNSKPITTLAAATTTSITITDSSPSVSSSEQKIPENNAKCLSELKTYPGLKKKTLLKTNIDNDTIEIIDDDDEEDSTNSASKLYEILTKPSDASEHVDEQDEEDSEDGLKIDERESTDSEDSENESSTTEPKESEKGASGSNPETVPFKPRIFLKPLSELLAQPPPSTNETIVSDNKTKDKKIKRRKYNCEFCNKEFRRRTKFDNHKSQYKCNLCEFTTCKVNQLTAHSNKTHKDTVNCAPCKKVFSSAEELQKHNTEVHSCNGCGRFIYTDLSKHRTMRSCYLCSFTVCNQAALVRHLGTMHDIKYSCVKCKLSFQNQVQLQEHQKQNHMCPKCNVRASDPEKHLCQGGSTSQTSDTLHV